MIPRRLVIPQMPIHRPPMEDAYGTARRDVAGNRAAEEVLRGPEHHTATCAIHRLGDICSCDLVIHLADVIREARGG